MNHQIVTKNHVRQAVINGVFPSRTITVCGLPFKFTFTDETFPTAGGRKQLQFVERVTSCEKLPGSHFVKKLHPVIYRELVYTFFDFQTTAGDQLFNILEEFADTPESRNYWEIFKATQPKLAINLAEGCLNTFQRKWILINTLKDKQDAANLISQVFDALKPWLNLDLFSQISKDAENCRENAFYNEEDMSVIDMQLKKKAQEAYIKQQARKDVAQNDNDLDEISIGEK